MVFDFGMVRDYMTKPLQGALFRKFRDLILGMVHVQDSGKGSTRMRIWKSEKKKSKKKKSFALSNKK